MEYVFATAVVGLLGAIILGAVAAFQKRALPVWGRVVLALLLLAPIPFSFFGFAASFEPGEYHWVWRMAYAIVILGCTGGIVRLCWRRSGNASTAASDRATIS